ncbi:MAG: nuclease [Terriglobales bacterium]
MKSKLLFFVLFSAALAFGWGDDGHKIINRAAVTAVPADMPAFFRAGIERIVYNGPEPDRWREKTEPQLKASQEPDHYIDLERVSDMGELPESRYEFIKLLYAKRARTTENPDDFLPEKVGFQPYIALEIYGRLKVAFRQYRQLKAAGLPTDAAEQNALFYAGWLGHYVGDAANPLHTTIQYDGWTGPNPNGYTTAKIHWPFESDMVVRNLPFMSDIGTLVSAPKPLESPFRDYVAYIEASNKLVEPFYQLEKKGDFNDGGNDEGKKFVRSRLAVGAQMLANMYYTAWVESEKMPEPKKPQAAATPANGPAAPSTLQIKVH